MTLSIVYFSFDFLLLNPRCTTEITMIIIFYEIVMERKFNHRDNSFLRNDLYIDIILEFLIIPNIIHMVIYSPSGNYCYYLQCTLTIFIFRIFLSSSHR